MDHKDSWPTPPTCTARAIQPSAFQELKAGIAQQIGVYYAVIMQTISLKLPDHLLAQLESEAKARRVTKSSLIRESLEKALRTQSRAGTPSCYVLARDLAGSLKGLPEDLAENPKYLEGFGR